MCPTRCLQQKEGPGPQELGCCSPRPGRRQTSKLRGEKWKQRPGSSLPCSSQHAPLQADGEHHYGLGCSSPSEEGMICTVSSSALPLGTQWLCFMVNKHCTRDSWLQWRDGELMICCSSGGCAQSPACPCGVFCVTPQQGIFLSGKQPLFPRSQFKCVNTISVSHSGFQCYLAAAAIDEHPLLHE